MQDGSDLSSNASTLSVKSEAEEQAVKLSLPIAQSSPLACSGAVQDTKDSEFSTKICRVIVKGVCGKALSREECVKLLKSKFTVRAKNLTSLTYSQCLQVAATKLVRSKYVSVPENVKFSKLKTEDIVVNKEIIGM